MLLVLHPKQTKGQATESPTKIYMLLVLHPTKLKNRRVFLNTTGQACLDPGIFIRGVPGQSDKKKALTFFLFFFLVLSLFYGQFQGIPFFKVPEGVHHFPGGPTFSRGGGGGGGAIAYSL